MGGIERPPNISISFLNSSMRHHDTNTSLFPDTNNVSSCVPFRDVEIDIPDMKFSPGGCFFLLEKKKTVLGYQTFFGTFCRAMLATPLLMSLINDFEECLDSNPESLP
jgi:hypothetical protein